MKGNCKFGPKCANAHVLPDGRRVNYKGGPLIGGHLNLGGRVNPDAYHGQSSALTNSFIRANGVPSSPYGRYAPYGQEDGTPLTARASIDIAGVPTIDASYASHPGSNYGSPPRDDDVNRFGMGLSPIGKGLSVLDAPLPASFDSNGVSWIARHGPIASSVPAKFGLESPPGSIGAAKDGRTSEALKSLHSSAFGDDTKDRFNGIPSSPPGAPAEEYFGKRIMHSHRVAKPKPMSASLPKAVDQDWDNSFTFEEDYLPETLKDLMTPQEKARRDSRNADEGGRPILHSGTGTPINETASSKFGSPSNASPSRWGPLFQRHQQQKEEEERATSSSRVSSFGHVGSPLRNSTLHPGASPSARPITRTSLSGDSSPYVSSPPRQSSMSIISQQLQRTRLGRAESSGSDSSLLPIGATRASSTPIGTGAGKISLSSERQVSSSSIGNGGSGRFTTPIDEEQGDFVFSMDGMEDESEKKEKEKRNSGGWTLGSSSRPANFGSIGGGKNGVSSGTNGSAVDRILGAR